MSCCNNWIIKTPNVVHVKSRAVLKCILRKLLLHKSSYKFFKVLRQNAVADIYNIL